MINSSYTSRNFSVKTFWNVLVEYFMFFMEKTNLGLSEQKLKRLKDMLAASHVNISKLHKKE